VALLRSSAAMPFETLADCNATYADVRCIILGTGRFIRAVLVPMLDGLGQKVILCQPRGDSYVQYQEARPDGTYEVDVVADDGSISTELVSNVVAVGSSGSEEGKQALLSIVPELTNVDKIAVGLTEAGLKPGSPALAFLSEILAAFQQASPDRKISIINTDNLAGNGDAIRAEVHSVKPEVKDWCDSNITFHNSMVDRIVGQREGDGNIPRAEAMPAKAVVIEDLTKVLNQEEWDKVDGAYLRTQVGELGIDQQLKLRIANALHTALVHVAALSAIKFIHEAMAIESIPQFLEELYEADIRPGLPSLAANVEGIDEATVLEWGDAAFADWMRRLYNPGMDFSCWFVCQNCTQKIGQRFLPSVKDNIAAGGEPSKLVAFCIASIMRFLTPLRAPDGQPSFVGCAPCKQTLAKLDVPNGYAVCDGDSLEYQWNADIPAVLPVLFPLRNLALTHGREAIFSVMVKKAATQFLELVPGVTAAADFGPLVDLVTDQYQEMIDGTPALDVMRSALHIEMALSPRNFAKRRAVCLEVAEEAVKVQEDVDAKGTPLTPLREEFASEEAKAAAEEAAAEEAAAEEAPKEPTAKEVCQEHSHDLIQHADQHMV